MPGMDGFETVNQLLELGVQSKVFALTASATQGIRQQSLASGFHEFITKPIRLITMQEAILKWFPL